MAKTHKEEPQPAGEAAAAATVQQQRHGRQRVEEITRALNASDAR
jgi:hypothetical protein